MTAGPRRDSPGDEAHALVVVLGTATEAHPLPRAGRVTIGRSRDNDIRIDDKSISRHHAVLHVGSDVSIEDLGSANGTRVRDLARRVGSEDGSATEPYDDTRVPPNRRVVVGPHHVLQIGSVVVAIQPATRVTERAPRPTLHASGSEMVVVDPAMASVVELSARSAASDMTVLLLGETGVGKEVLAEHIVVRSARAARPFVRLNCSALSESLLESELFGHERGAFTGALAPRPGLVEAAAGGTLFLDEVGDMSPNVQAKLLRVFEEGRVRRVGSTLARPVDVRFIAATNRELAEDVARGSFRQDLFYRLNGVTIRIPPLRDRPRDVVPLARAFLEAACRAARRRPPVLGPEAVSALERHLWPGNVRELRNVIGRAVLVCDEHVIRASHLAFEQSPRATESGAPNSARAEPTEAHGIERDEPGEPDLSELKGKLEQLERDRIVWALEQCAGNQTRAAALLGVSRGTLVARMNAFALPRPRKRSP